MQKQRNKKRRRHTEQNKTKPIHTDKFCAHTHRQIPLPQRTAKDYSKQNKTKKSLIVLAFELFINSYLKQYEHYHHWPRTVSSLHQSWIKPQTILYSQQIHVHQLRLNHVVHLHLEKFSFVTYNEIVLFSLTCTSLFSLPRFFFSM